MQDKGNLWQLGENILTVQTADYHLT
jgi:hypothetical protein